MADGDNSTSSGEAAVNPLRVTRAALRRKEPLGNGFERQLAAISGAKNDSDSGRSTPSASVNSSRERDLLGGGSTSSNPYSKATIKVGGDFQATVPAANAKPSQSPDRSVCLWSAAKAIGAAATDAALEDFCNVARLQFAYAPEQALGLLLFHSCDVDRALVELANYAPSKERWSTQDCVLFEQAFSMYGKNFAKVKQLLPHKTKFSLIEYYYKWKKSHSYTAYMDQRENYSEDDGDADYAPPSKVAKKRSARVNCENCGTKCVGAESPHGPLCNACHMYWTRCNSMRPCKRRRDSSKGAQRSAANARGHIVLPSGIEFKQESLELFMRKAPISAAPSDDIEMIDDSNCSNVSTGGKTKTLGDEYLKTLDYRVYGARQKTLKLQTALDASKAALQRQGIDELRLPRQPKIRLTYRWSDQDRFLAVQGFRQYGKDFEAISQVLRNKTADMIQWFFKDYNELYRLDSLVADFEADRAKQEASLQDEKQEKAEAIIDLDD